MYAQLILITYFTPIMAEKDVSDYIYVLFTKTCYKEFFGAENLSSQCISDTISRLISILMVSCALFNQMPQIHKIVKSKSIKGISFNAYYTELYLLSFITAYNIFKQTKFILYGDNTIVAIEYCIVLALFIYFDKNLNFHQWLFKIVLFSLINIPLYIGYGTNWLFKITIYINMTLLFAARFLQIRLNFINKNTGQLSLLTQLQNYAGSVARLFTLLNDGGDFSYTLYIMEDNILGLILTIQIFNTWNNERKKLKTQSKENSSQSTSVEIKYDQI